MQDKNINTEYILKKLSKLCNNSNFLFEAVIVSISLMEMKKAFDKFNTLWYHITLHVLHYRKRKKRKQKEEN